MELLWHATVVVRALGDCRIALTLHGYPLDLRSSFGTSHSSTMTRTNALLRVSIAGLDGFGEAGLPPKKFGCYESDLGDIVAFFRAWQEHLESLGVNQQSAPIADPLALCPPEFFSTHGMRLGGPAGPTAGDHDAGGSSEAVHGVRWLLNALDSFPTHAFGASYKAAHCCLEMAAFDLWGRAIRLPIHEMVCPSAALGAPAATAAANAESSTRLVGRSFYTIGLNADVDEMVRTCEFGLRTTSLLKIKLDGDAARAAHILARLHACCTEITANANAASALAAASASASSTAAAFVWSIDANAAWTRPALALEFLEVLRPYAPHIYMVEQPFGLFRARPSGEDSHSNPSGGADVDHRAAVSIVRDGRFVDFCTSAAEHERIALASSALADASAAADAATEASQQLAEWRAWIDVKRAYAAAGLLLFADESICDARDIEALGPLVHGVNVKLEKCAGLRGALRAIAAARQYAGRGRADSDSVAAASAADPASEPAASLRVWIGTMVGSQLNSTGAAQLLPLAVFGDMDGALLTTAASQAFAGGMRWNARVPDGEIRLPTGGGGAGLGCETIIRP